MNDTATDLLDAVDALTLDRKLTTIQETETETGVELKAITITHPPLLTMLAEGTGITKGAKSSSIRIPIDADGLEMWGWIRDAVKLWCRQLGAAFEQDDLTGSLRRWYISYENRRTANRVSFETDRDVARMVQGWARMIENKFDPPEKREWKEPCPAFVGDRRCGARRVIVNGEERFAIVLNVSTLTAECAECGCKWEGLEGVKVLRYETNMAALIREQEEKERDLALAVLAAGDGRHAEERATM